MNLHLLLDKYGYLMIRIEVLLCIMVISAGCAGRNSATVLWPDPYALPTVIRELDKMGKKVGAFDNNGLGCPVGQGTVFLKNGVSVHGSIWIKPTETSTRGGTIKYYPLLEVVTMPWSEVNPTNIKDSAVFRKLSIDKVDSAIMNVPLPYQLGKTTTFINLYKRDFWRVCLRKGKVSILDLSDISFRDQSYYTNKLGRVNKMKMLEGRDPISIYNCSLFFGMTERHVKAVLLRFIRKRYSVNIADNKFKNAGDMLEYIADEENKHI